MGDWESKGRFRGCISFEADAFLFHHTLVSFIDDKRRAFLSSIDDKTMLLWRCTH